MGKYTKTEIIDKARELAKMIAETEEVNFLSGRKQRLMKIKRLGKKLTA